MLICMVKKRFLPFLIVAVFSAGSSSACASVRLRPVGAVTVGGSASTVLVLMEVAAEVSAC
jgi:hypothetical protein